MAFYNLTLRYSKPRSSAYSAGGLTGSQWKMLLKSFDQQTAQGRCEHAAAFCMLELGLRNCEVVNLRLEDIGWNEGFVRVPVMKTDIPRLVPLSPPVRQVLSDYIKRFRGRSHHHRLQRHV